MTVFVPRVCDVSKYEFVTDPNGFQQAKSAGIWGIISKATQGITITDPLYHIRHMNAKMAGMLWGAYHFGGSGNVQAQFDHYVSVSQLDNDDLGALDFEPYAPDQMSMSQAVQWLHKFEDKFKRKAIIYSGNLLKEKIGTLSSTDHDYVCSHRLWLAQYSYSFTLPTGFKKYWLWQYTGDGSGPTPHWVNGIQAPGNKGLDLNVCYESSFDELKANWSGAPQVVPVVPPQVNAAPVPTPVPEETLMDKLHRQAKDLL